VKGVGHTSRGGPQTLEAKPGGFPASLAKLVERQAQPAIKSRTNTHPHHSKG
jgi:hypothetical protein